MRVFNLFLEAKSNNQLPILQKALGLLKAIHWNHLTTHWQSPGKEYANHLLFQRLYENLVDEIDDLAEKMVSYYGINAVEPNLVLKISQEYIKNWSEKENGIERAIIAEKELQDLFKTVYDSLKNANSLSLGMDDFIMALCNKHEKHLYLLGRSEKKSTV